MRRVDDDGDDDDDEDGGGNEEPDCTAFTKNKSPMMIVDGDIRCR